MNNLSDEMQARLDKWMANPLPVKAAEKVRGSNYVSRRDYGDDIRDFERKDAEQWEREFNSNPIYRRDI